MDFEHDVQRLSACQTLMLVAGRPDLWDADGPTLEAEELRANNGGSLSPGERVMLLVAFTFFDGDRKLGFFELARLSPENLFAVGSLLAARAVDRMQLPGVSRSQIEEWIGQEQQLVKGE